MEPTGISVIAPSVVAVGEPFSLGIKVLTEPYVVGTSTSGAAPSVKGEFNLSPRGISYMDNVPEQWDGAVAIQASDGYRGPDVFSFADR